MRAPVDLGANVEVLARPGVAERILEVAGEHEPVRPPGPDREQLLALLS